MKIYVLSLSVGLLVGIIYGLLNVRSPAPPIVALLGLFGILVGEQAIPLARHLRAGAPDTVLWFRTHSLPHMFGELPAAGKQPQSIRQPTDPGTG